MYHQITFEELGMIPRYENRKKHYTTPCGGCICNHCANNVDCIDPKSRAEFGCFNCDECLHYNGDYGADNWKAECKKYVVTDAFAKITRLKFKIVTK